MLVCLSGGVWFTQRVLLTELKHLHAKNVSEVCVLTKTIPKITTTFLKKKPKTPKLLKLKWKKKNKCHYLKINAPSVWTTDIRQDPCFDIYDMFYPCHPKITATIETHQMRQHFSSLQFSRFSCSFYTKFWPYYPLLQQKPRVIRLGNIFTIFHCPLLVSPFKQWTLYSFVIRQEW